MPNVGRVPEIKGVLPEQMVVVTVEIVLLARAGITVIATVSEKKAGQTPAVTLLLYHLFADKVPGE